MAVANHFIHGTQAECKCGWRSEYVDTRDLIADVSTATKAHEAHVAEMGATDA